MSILFAVLLYAASALLIAGLIVKIRQYAKTPAPLKIPTTPAPLTKTGVAWRLFTEVVFFNSLWKSNKWIWIFGWLFHFSLLLALFRHLRYAVPESWFISPIFDNWIVQTFGQYAGYGMLFGLLGLLGRRIIVDRVRYISNPSDFAMLILILAIAGTGMLMSTWGSRIDLISFTAYLRSVLFFGWDFTSNPLPADALIMVHLSLVILLMIIFPVSKLLHAPGVFFSPTRNQTDTPREQRHVAPWARKLEADN